MKHNPADHIDDQYSSELRSWDSSITDGFWVGGHFPASNLSQGYHGILRQWWETYMEGDRALLISESRRVKEAFEARYPPWKITTLDFYPELADSNPGGCDIFADICANPFPIKDRRFDLIINQATLEHLYSPFDAMKNMASMLDAGGILVSHTHPPAGSYHSYPRDYFRFMKDWWYDLPKHIRGLELLELLMVDNRHVFTCYRSV